MQTRSSTHNSVLGKRQAESSSAKSDVANHYTPLTPDSSPNPKRIRTSPTELDDGSNKENIPPLRFHILNGSPSRRRSLRRASTETSINSARYTPRRHASMSGIAGSPRTPRTPVTGIAHLSLITPPSTPATLRSISSKARALLRATCNNASALAGREKEREDVRSFLLPFLKDASATERPYPVLYISGSPGTGKTALVNDILRSMASELASASVDVLAVNCMALANVEALWASLIQVLQGGKSKSNKSGANRDPFRQTLERLLRGRKSKCILFLDELDHIGSSAQALSELFALINEHAAFIRLIGIANTHTLTSSSSTTISAVSTENVKAVHFQPYTSQQLLDILNSRLEPLFNSEVVAASEDPKKFLSKPTLTLLSKKIASQTGDVRALFEVLRGAIDIAVNAGSKALDASTPSVTPAHVLEALKAYAPAAKVSRATADVAKADAPAKVVDNETTMKIRNLGLQARVVLLALLLASKRVKQGLCLSGSPSNAPAAPRTPSKRCHTVNTTSTMEISQLHSYYSAILTRSEGGLFTPVSRSEFGDLVGVLETVGLVTLTSRGGGKLPTTPSKSGRRGGGLTRSMSSSFNLGSSGSQEVSLAESLRVEEVVRGLGIDVDFAKKDKDEDVREEEVRAIWSKESMKIAKEAKALAATAASAGVRAFEDAMED